MRIAVLPFNAGPDTKPGLGRQLANFLADSVRTAAGAEINSVNLLAQIEQDGQQRAALVNVSDKLNEPDFLAPLFGEAGAEKAMDGLLTAKDGGYELVVRFHQGANNPPIWEKTFNFEPDGVFGVLHELILELADQAEVELPEAVKTKLEFGTEKGNSFLDFMEGYDAFQYIQSSNGMVANEFDPQMGYGALIASLEADPDFMGPYEMLLALARSCGQYRIGTLDAAIAAVEKAIEIAPEDFRGHYAMAELFQGVEVWNRASDEYEKALTLHDKAKPEYVEDGKEEDWKLEHASILSRIGVAQMGMGMPVNAELNFKKAIDLEGDDKPSLNLLAGVLQNSNRGHEIPNLWRQQLERQPNNPEVYAKYAIALFQAERVDDSVKVFEEALDKLESNEDKLVVKRFYAPLLAQRGEHDRAMDFYEDCLDEAPSDVGVLWEYAQTLKAADREFEVPQVLDTLIASNPDPNMRAEAFAWKTEITEPKRAEAVRSADVKMSQGDFEGALKELKPLRNWLADYWKLWAILAAAYNRTGQHDEARDAAERLINMYPGFEMAYIELMGALNSLGRNDDAYNVMRYAASNMPQSLNVHVNLALAAQRAGHVDEARGLAKQIREAVGPNPELDQVFGEIDRG